MKPDLNLVRLIIIDIQKLPPGQPCERLTYPGQYERQTVIEHVSMLIEAGLLEGEVYRVLPGDLFLIERITRKGYDFIEAAKDESIWLKVTRNVNVFPPKEPFTIDLLLDLLKTEASQKLERS